MCDARKADEIKVTPEMIEAGVLEYLANRIDLDDREVVKEIFMAMVEARKEP